jgi:hypothetical protein
VQGAGGVAWPLAQRRERENVEIHASILSTLSSFLLHLDSLCILVMFT